MMGYEFPMTYDFMHKILDDIFASFHVLNTFLDSAFISVFKLLLSLRIIVIFGWIPLNIYFIIQFSFHLSFLSVMINISSGLPSYRLAWGYL